MAETKTRTETAVWPCLSYNDAPKAIQFLVDAFGFEIGVINHGATDAEIMHAELRWPRGGGVMPASVRPDSNLFVPPGVGLIYLVTDDPDGLYARAVNAGATVVRPLEDLDYGSRDFTVRDPEGVLWSFGTYAGE